MSVATFAIKFLKINILWAPLLRIYSGETYRDFPGDMGNVFSRTGEEKPRNAHQKWWMSLFCTHTFIDNKILQPVKQSTETGSECSSPGLVGRVYLGSKASMRFFYKTEHFKDATKWV